MKHNKPVHAPSLQFPARDLELKLATVRFTCPNDPTRWTAEFTMVRGYFFSIVFDKSPQRIRKRDDILLETVEIHHDPMKVRPQARKRRASARPIQLQGWLAEFSV